MQFFIQVLELWQLLSMAQVDWFGTVGAAAVQMGSVTM